MVAVFGFDRGGSWDAGAGGCCSGFGRGFWVSGREEGEDIVMRDWEKRLKERSIGMMIPGSEMLWKCRQFENLYIFQI